VRRAAWDARARVSQEKRLDSRFHREHGKTRKVVFSPTVGLKSRERPIATRREARTFFYLASFVVAPEALLAFFRAP
jgi:hypothetical protein